MHVFGFLIVYMILIASKELPGCRKNELQVPIPATELLLKCVWVPNIYFYISYGCSSVASVKCVFMRRVSERFWS